MVEAGVIGVCGATLHNTCPVTASATVPLNFPSAGSADAGPSAAAIPRGVGNGASSGTGVTCGAAVIGAGTGAIVSSPRLAEAPCVLTAITRTAATASTATTTAARSIRMFRR